MLEPHLGGLNPLLRLGELCSERWRNDLDGYYSGESCVQLLIKVLWEA